MDTVEVGRALALRHAEEPVPTYEPERSLLNYAEVPRVKDWTLRSALVRLAQPDAERVGRLLTAMRRLDATLHQATRVLERHVVAVDPGAGGHGREGPRADVRSAELARVVARGADRASLLAGYERHAELEAEERIAVPLVEVAVRFEALSRTLAGWAAAGPRDPPLAELDEVRAWAWARMDELGVPMDAGRPPGRRVRSRS